jgi:hypothetical protein
LGGASQNFSRPMGAIRCDEIRPWHLLCSTISGCRICFVSSSSRDGAAFAASSGGTETFHIIMMALTLQRCAAVAWGFFAYVLFWSVSLCGWVDSSSTRRILPDLHVYIGTCAYAMSEWPTLAARIDQVMNLCIVCISASRSYIILCEIKNERTAKSDIVTKATRCRLFCAVLSRFRWLF